METIPVVEVLRRHVYLIASLCLLTMLAGYGISFSPLIPEKFDASALVLVRPHQPIQIAPNNSGKEVLDFPVAQTPIVETASKTYIQIIRSPSLIGEVVRELKLDQKPKKTHLYDYIAPYVKEAIELVKYGQPREDDPFTKAVSVVTKGLTLKAYEDTYVFEIKYSDEDPQTAADVSNTTATLFIKFMENVRSSEAEEAASRLRSELEKSRQRLVAARESLRTYKEAHGTFLYEPEYDAKLRVISGLTIELAKLDESLAAGTFDTKGDAKKRARLIQILNERRAELASLPTIERELRLRQEDVDVANTTYATVAKELKDAEIKSDARPETRLISPASVPRLPSHPRRGLIALASLLTGLLAGVALAFFLEYINRTVRGIRDIEEVVGLKVIATIPPARTIRDFAHPEGSAGRTAGGNEVDAPIIAGGDVTDVPRFVDGAPDPVMRESHLAGAKRWDNGRAFGAGDHLARGIAVVGFGDDPGHAATGPVAASPAAAADADLLTARTRWRRP